MQDFVTLNTLGKAIKVLIRKSNRAKHIGIRLTYKGAELVIPRKSNVSTGYNFLLTKESWVRAKLHHSDEQTGSDNKIPIFGILYKINYIISDSNLVILKNGIVEVHSKNARHSNTLIRFLKEQLLVEIVKLANKIQDKYLLHYKKIRIMNNTSKWGSCSKDKVLAFHWRLIFAPKEVLEYLVVHEMCHLQEMNHSKQFWFLVAKICPKYQIGRLWLKKNGKLLHHYLPIKFLQPEN